MLSEGVFQMYWIFLKIHTLLTWHLRRASLLKVPEAGLFQNQAHEGLFGRVEVGIPVCIVRSCHLWAAVAGGEGGCVLWGRAGWAATQIQSGSMYSSLTDHLKEIYNSDLGSIIWFYYGSSFKNQGNISAGHRNYCLLTIVIFEVSSNLLHAQGHIPALRCCTE